MKRLEELANTSEWLSKIYDDADGSRRDELASMAPGSTDRVFEVFYDRVKDIRNYYRKFPDLANAPAVDMDVDSGISVSVAFSGEECGGRCLDLHELHNQFLNLTKDQVVVDYMTFLETFHEFDKLPAEKKAGAGYKQYLKDLLSYLLDFFRRSLPLDSVTTLLQRAEQRYKDSLAATANGSGATAMEISGQVPLTTTDNPLYCLACEKQFTKETIFQAHLPGKKHKKAYEKLQKDSAAAVPGVESVPLLEKKIIVLADYLGDVILNTKKNVEKRQSMSAEEKEANIDFEGAEYEDIVDENEEEESEDDEKIWNPKGLPLDVTGKPIPYWLWKLHGLGVEYQCEICGNYSYWGHYAFEKHFQEWRHQHALKILGIPNHKAFNNVTTIKEAIALYQKLKLDQNKAGWRPEMEEEYEDREGNVIPKKTYEDMLRQGIL
jgi:splicing factor 3A subunit 3